MFVHIVFWKLREPGGNGRTRDENVRELERMFNGLRGVVPGLQRIDFNSDALHTADSADVALYTEFDSQEAYKGYVAHPAHQEIVSYFKGNASERRVVDYEI